jgi:hypothetical protein
MYMDFYRIERCGHPELFHLRKVVIKEALGTGDPALSAPLGLNLLAGCLMNSSNRPATPRKFHINQQLADLNFLAGYLMGLCSNQPESDASK